MLVYCTASNLALSSVRSDILPLTSVIFMPPGCVCLMPVCVLVSSNVGDGKEYNLSLGIR